MLICLRCRHSSRFVGDSGDDGVVVVGVRWLILCLEEWVIRVAVIVVFAISLRFYWMDRRIFKLEEEGEAKFSLCHTFLLRIEIPCSDSCSDQRGEAVGDCWMNDRGYSSYLQLFGFEVLESLEKTKNSHSTYSRSDPCDG